MRTFENTKSNWQYENRSKKKKNTRGKNVIIPHLPELNEEK